MDINAFFPGMGFTIDRKIGQDGFKIVMKSSHNGAGEGGSVVKNFSDGKVEIPSNLRLPNGETPEEIEIFGIIAKSNYEQTGGYNR